MKAPLYALGAFGDGASLAIAFAIGIGFGFALERAGNDQDRIFTIDEAIRAITEGAYGACESCGNLIEKPRLHALPFAKNCIKCQSEMERGRNGGGGRRQIP